MTIIYIYAITCRQWGEKNSKSRETQNFRFPSVYVYVFVLYCMSYIAYIHVYVICIHYSVVKLLALNV